MPHWAEQYIGIPWISGGRNTKGFDCWGLVRHCQKKHFNNEIPAVDVDALNRESVILNLKKVTSGKDWERIHTMPIEGDCIILSNSSNPLHVGIAITPDTAAGVLHCVRRSGVIYTKLTDLPISGWRRRKIYRWRSL